VPVTYTVTVSQGYAYSLTYKEGNTDITPDDSKIFVTKNGDSYSIKLPRPSDWTPGNANPVRTNKTYTIIATMEGVSTEMCGSSVTISDTATIILKDEPNENCQ
jgi:hypothetical protein